jgi:limonene 1,2-monooxygenase
MPFGLFMMPLHPPERSFAESYDRDLAQIVLAHRLGYHEVWIGEYLTEPWETLRRQNCSLARLSSRRKRLSWPRA